MIYCLKHVCRQTFTLKARLTYWGPGIIKKHCYPKEKKDFAELGTKFKASHVKALLWWLAVVASKAAITFPHDTCFHATQVTSQDVPNIVALFSVNGKSSKKV